MLCPDYLQISQTYTGAPKRIESFDYDAIVALAAVVREGRFRHGGKIAERDRNRRSVSESSSSRRTSVRC